MIGITLKKTIFISLLIIGMLATPVLAEQEKIAGPKARDLFRQMCHDEDIEVIYGGSYGRIENSKTEVYVGWKAQNKSDVRDSLQQFLDEFIETEILYYRLDLGWTHCYGVWVYHPELRIDIYHYVGFKS